MEIIKILSKSSKVILIYSSLAFLSAPAAYAERSCSNKLESFYSQMPEWIINWNEPDSIDVPQSCMHRAMGVFNKWTDSQDEERVAEGLESIGHYAYCENGKVTRSNDAPCATDDYLNTVSNSYNKVLKCLNLKPKDFFAITAVESGFHVNSTSIIGADIGIGQITPIAHLDINLEWQNYSKLIFDSTNPDCEDIKPLLEKISNSEEQLDLICELTDLPDNPVKNLLYMGFLQFKNQSYIENLYEKSNVRKRISTLIGREIESQEEARIQEILVTLSYNAGSVGAIDALNGFLEVKERSLKEHNENLREINEQIINFYLDHKNKLAADEKKAADLLLIKRDRFIDHYNNVQEMDTSSVISVELFGINDLEGSFGKFLVDTNTSNYIDVLKNRIKYVEESIDHVGKCAPLNYLEKINQ